MQHGRYGAVIEKVKKGSVADVMGHLLPGDEVSRPTMQSWWKQSALLMINIRITNDGLQGGRMAGQVPAVSQLRGGGFLISTREESNILCRQVRDIIAACRQDRAIELLVSRDSALAARRNNPREGLGEADLAR